MSTVRSPSEENHRGMALMIDRIARDAVSALSTAKTPDSRPSSTTAAKMLRDSFWSARIELKLSAFRRSVSRRITRLIWRYIDR